MPKVDEELTRRFLRAERPVGSDGLFEGLARRRHRRRTLQRVQAGALAVVVLGATAIGFVALRSVFGDSERDVGGSSNLPANGAIVFSRMGDDGRFHLYAAAPDGSTVRQITDDATNDTDPAVSPDGTTIAYAHDLDQGLSVVATVPVQGGTVTWQTAEHQAVEDPAWAPQGGRFAFVGYTIDTADLYVTGVNGEQTRRVQLSADQNDVMPTGYGDFPAHPTWSPDGTWLAVAVHTQGGNISTSWDLAVVHADGTGLRWLVATSDVDEEAPAWSPDGTRIAFTRPGDQGDEVWTMSPDGTDETLVARAVQASLEPDLAWAPDGSALLVSDGEWIYRVDATPTGDPDGNFVQLVRGESPSWQPIPAGSEPSATVSPEPSASPSPEPEGKDIGLGFNLCDLQRLGGIDWFGTSDLGAAWTGTRVRENGTCPHEMSASLVVADLDGDGEAETWSPIDICISCEPWARIDLDANGAEELVVLLQGGTTPQYGFYHAVPEGGPRAGGIYPIFIQGPAAPAAGFPQDGMVTVWAGGDAGDSYALRCEGFPEDPVLVAASVHAPVDTDIREIRVTRLKLETSDSLDSAHFVVLDSTSPTEAHEDWGGDADACGVDFNPWA